MPAVPNWSSPTQFDLTNPYNGTLSFNVEDSSGGIFLLDQSGCQFTIGVRSTTDNVPQSDGAILHNRFLTGTQMPLSIWLGEDTERPACGELLTTMLDKLSGAFRSLLNAGDNEGRLAWEAAGQNERMLDDVRLLVYPVFTMDTKGTVTVTIDSQYPYAQDLTQQATVVLDGDTEALNNIGTADYWPVFRVEGPTSDFTIENHTTNVQFVYDASLPGADSIGASDCAEIDTFRNTIYLAPGCGAGNGANLKAGVDQLNSDYLSLQAGTVNQISIDGADMTVLWAPAWG